MTKKNKKEKERRQATRLTMNAMRVPVPRPMLTGTGDYSVDNPGPFGKVGAMIGKRIGSLFGPKGAEVGEHLGKLATYIGQIFGSGDYEVGPGAVDHNLLVPGTNYNDDPQFRSREQGTMIAMTEYIGVVKSAPVAGDLLIQRLSINPGQHDTFPWLSDIADSWQKYKLHGAIIEYRPLAGMSATVPYQGFVSLSTFYDNQTSEPETKVDLLNAEYSQSCAPWQKAIHCIECSEAARTEKYVRALPWATNQDENTLRVSDVGQFYVATGGNPNVNADLGELWITYCVELKHRRMFGGQVGSDVYTAVWNATRGEATSTAPMGENPTETYDNIGMTLTVGPSGGDTYLSFPHFMQAGKYLCLYQFSGASHTSGTVPQLDHTWEAVSGCTVLEREDLACQLSLASPSSVYHFGVLATVQITDGGAQLLVPYYTSGSTWPTTNTEAQILITQIPEACSTAYTQAYTAPLAEVMRDDDEYSDIVRLETASQLSDRRSVRSMKR